MNKVLRISKETGILFIIGTSGATNLPQVIVRNVLQRGGVVVEVNTDESLFTALLKDKKNGIILRESSSVFLTKLDAEIQQLTTNS